MKSTSRAARLVRIADKVARLLDRRSRGRAHLHAELVGDHIGERRLAEAGRAVQQDVVERLAALLRGGNRDLQILAHAVLADVLVEPPRAEARFVLRVLVDARGGRPGDRWPCGSARAALLRQLAQRLLERALESAVGRGHDR